MGNSVSIHTVNFFTVSYRHHPQKKRVFQEQEQIFFLRLIPRNVSLY